MHSKRSTSPSLVSNWFHEYFARTLTGSQFPSVPAWYHFSRVCRLFGSCDVLLVTKLCTTCIKHHSSVLFSLFWWLQKIPLHVERAHDHSIYTSTISMPCGMAQCVISQMVVIWDLSAFLEDTVSGGEHYLVEHQPPLPTPVSCLLTHLLESWVRTSHTAYISRVQTQDHFMATDRKSVV